MELRHLRYFVAVAEELNFTRAAERLHIAQPPLSRQIQQLEEELGLLLLDRGARPLQLTEAGRFFYAQARNLLAQAQGMRAMTRKIALARRQLVIGYVGSTLYRPLPEVIRRFRAIHVDTELSLLEMTSLEQVEALKAGRIDVGFGRLLFDDPALEREVLAEEPLWLALPLEHPLARREGPLRLRDAAEETVLIYPRQPRPSYADQVLAAFRQRALEPAYALEVRELQTALGLVAAGMGVCVVPASVLRLRRDDVVYRPLTDEGLASPLIMSARRGDRSEELALIRRLLRELLPREEALEE